MQKRNVQLVISGHISLSEISAEQAPWSAQYPWAAVAACVHTEKISGVWPRCVGVTTWLYKVLFNLQSSTWHSASVLFGDVHDHEGVCHSHVV